MTGGPPAPTLAPEVMPVIPVQWDQPEDALLRGDILAWANVRVSAVALSYATAVLTNPAGSGILLVVEKLIAYHLAPAAAVLIVVSSDVGDVPLSFTTGFPTRSRDLRTLPVPSGSAATGATAQSASPTTNILTPCAIVPAAAINTPITIEAAVVLPPGRSLVVQNGTVGTGDLACTFFWRESPVSTAQQRDPR